MIKQNKKFYEIDNHRLQTQLHTLNNFFEFTDQFVKKSHNHIKTLVKMVNDLIESDDALYLLDTKLEAPKLQLPMIEEHHHYQKTINVNKNQMNDQPIKESLQTINRHIQNEIQNESEIMNREIQDNKNIVDEIEKSMNNFVERMSQIHSRNENQRIKVVNNLYHSQKDLEKLQSKEYEIKNDHSNIKVNINQALDQIGEENPQKNFEYDQDQEENIVSQYKKKIQNLQQKLKHEKKKNLQLKRENNDYYNEITMLNSKVDKLLDELNDKINSIKKLKQIIRKSNLSHVLQQNSDYDSNKKDPLEGFLYSKQKNQARDSNKRFQQITLNKNEFSD